MPDNKFVPPSDAVEVKSSNSFVPPSDAVEVKKKVATGLQSGQPKVSSSSATQKTAEQKPSVSSGSEDNIFSGYPGKEDKKYKLQNGMWYERSATYERGNGEKEYFYEKPITDAKRVESLNKVFKQDASTNEFQKIFVGYPNQQGAEYRIVNGVWQKKSYGSSDYTPIVNDNSVKALNSFFKQKGKKADERLNQASIITKGINAELLDADEEDLVPKLKGMFKGTDNDIFNIEEIGFGYDAVRITNKYTGEYTEVNIDNWSKDRNGEESKLLKGFIDVNLQFKDQAINKKNIQDLQNYVYKIQSTNRTEAMRIQKQIDELQKDVDADESLKKNYAMSQGKYSTQAIYNKGDVKAIKNTIKAKQGSAIILKEDKKKLDSDKKEADEKLAAGKINKSEYDFYYKEEFDQRQQEIFDRAKNLDTDLKSLAKESKKIDIIAGQYISSQENRGNIVSGTASSLFKGVATGLVGTTTFLMSLDPQYQNIDFKEMSDELSDLTTVGGSSKEYTTSENRGLIEKAMFGIVESIGQTAAGVGTSGVISMMGASYFNFRAEIDGNPETKDIPVGEKILLASALAAPIAILDKFGLDEALTKNPYSSKAINWILGKTFSSLPKNASKEVLESAIKSNLKAAVSKGLLVSTEKGFIEGTTEGLEANIEMGTKAAYNWAKGGEYFSTPKNAAEWWKNTSEAFAVGAVGGAALNLSTQAVKIPIDKMSKSDLGTAANSIIDKDIKDLVLTSLKSKVATGEMSSADAKEIEDNMNNLESIITKVPEDLTDEAKFSSVMLINEKAKLEKSIEGKDKALVTAQTDRINAINEELKAISINNSKTEQDATKESTEQQQEVPTESSTVEYQGADQGQQEVGQGEGSERTTTQPEANISDSNIPSEEAQVIPSIETKIEEHEQRTENEVVAPNIETTTTKKAKSIPRTRKALDVETNDLQDLVKKHFISGGKINVSNAMQSLFGNKGGKSVTSEYRKRIGLHSKGGQTIDGLAHLLWEQNRDTLGESVTTTEWRDAVESVLTSEVGTKNMIDSLLTKSEESVSDAETKYWENKYDMNAIQDFDESELMDAESVLDNMTDEEMAQMYDEIVASEQAEYNPTIEDAKNLDPKDKLYSKKIYDILEAQKQALIKFSKESSGSFIIPPSVLIKAIEGIQKAVELGMTFENAIRDYASKNNLKVEDIENGLYNVSEAQKAKTRERVTGEKQPSRRKSKEAIEAKELSKKNVKNITVDEVTALKDQIRLEAKAAKEGAKSVSNSVKEITKHFNNLSDKNKLSRKDLIKVINLISKVKDSESLNNTIPKLFDIMDNANRNIIEVDEYTALKDQLRLEAKAARESKADLKTKQADLIARFNAMKVKGKMNTNTVTAIINRIKNLNLDNQAKVDAFLDYAANVFKNVNYDTELSKGLKLKGAISKNLKGKANPFAKLAREFSKLNVRWVENIEEYNAIAEKIYNSARSSKFKKDENGKYILDLKQEADIQEVYDYFIKERDSQSQRLEDNYRKLYEETTGNSATGKTIAELKSEMALAKIDYTAEKRQAIEDKLDEFKDLAKSTPDVSDKVKEALNVDLDVLDIKEAVALLDALDTYFANGTTAKMSNIMGNYRGKYNAKNSKLRASKLRLAGSRKFGKVMNEYLSNLGITAERLFRGHTGGGQFQKESGFTSVYNGANRAETETRNKSDEYTKLFKKRKGFDTIENIYERNVMAFLDRSPEIQEDADFFAIRKGLLKQSYETLMNGSDAEKVMGEVYKKVFDKLDLDNAKDINDIIKNTSNDNVEAVRYIQQMFSDVHPELSEFALDMHNTMLARDNNYTPDIYKKTTDNRTATVFDESSFAFGNFANITLNTSEAGVLIESSRPKKLSDGMFVSLDFENNVFNAHRLALTDMYTAEGIRQFDSYMKSDDIKTIIPDSEDRQIMRDSMNGYVNDKKGKTFTEKALISEFKKLTSYFGKLGAFRALGSIRQFPIQYASAVTNALVATGFGKNGVYIDFKAPFDKRINKLINESGRSIANRGVESAISAMNKETDVMPVLNTSGKIVKVAEYPIDKIAQANAVVLKQVLGNADNYGARTMWWAFYKKSLADQGLKVDFDKINEKAADYAQSMTDRQAEVSDVSLRGKVFKSKDPTTVFIKDVLMPFAGFSLNQKNRLYSDFRNMFAGQSQEDRTFAARSFFATASEVAVTAKIRLYVATLIVSAAAHLLGLDDDDEEVKEMYDKLEKENKQNTYSRIIQDIASPNPIFDKFTLRQVNKLLDITGYSEPDMKEFDKMIEDIKAKKAYRGELLTDEEIAEKKEDYILDNKFNFYTSDDADWGSYGILPKKIEETQEIMSVYNTGKFQKEFGGKMVDYYLTESDRKKLKGIVALKLAANVLPSESDMISNKALRIIKEKGMSESKFKTYEQIKKETKITPFVEMLIRETTMSNEKIISYGKYAESDGQLSEKQIKEYINLKTIYGSKAIGFMEEIKSGKTAKQIMGK
jgi:hypothetical protein